MITSGTTNPFQVLVVDDHPVVRDGIRRTIEREKDFTVCGEASSGAEALEILSKGNCDAAIVDISLKGKSGLELIKEIRSRKYDCPVLVLTVHDDVSHAERALRAGARGYILKQTGARQIVVGLRKIISGEIFVDEIMSSKLISGLIGKPLDARIDDPISQLTDRELEVFEAVGKGETTRAIAGLLNISISTVETYKSNIKEKMHLKNAAELSSFAARWLTGHHI